MASKKLSEINNPNLSAYLEKNPEARGARFLELDLNVSVRDNEDINYIYRVDDHLFVRVYNDEKGNRYYDSIGPTLTPEEQKQYVKVKEALLQNAFYTAHKPKSDDAFRKEIVTLLNEAVIQQQKGKGFLGSIGNVLAQQEIVSEKGKQKMLFFLMQDFLELGLVSPLMRDEYLEEISCIGTRPMWVVHKVFGAMQTNKSFGTETELQRFMYKTTEILDRPATEAHPIVDLALPDGSRLNVLFGEDVSKRGTSFTIRRFTETPVSITQLISWKTISAQEAAYFWLAVEHGASIFMCGETASGKTTTLKALTVFIDPTYKIYSVEDTPEIYVPHENWQRTITLEGKVGMFKLLEISLVSRPNYVIVGEFRDEEGAVAFQSMQAGYPVMATFHAGDITSLIQRLTGDPIYIPKEFIGNLNVVVFQSALQYQHQNVRRAETIHEIEGYSSKDKAIITKQVFSWNPRTDNHEFPGIYNSYVLESIVANRMRLSRRKDIYGILEERRKFLESLVSKKVFDYYKVFEAVQKFRQQAALRRKVS